MDLTEITTMLMTLLGVLTPIGGIGAFIYRKQEKRLKEAEAGLAEANAQKAASDVRASEWHIWEEQCNRLTDLNNDLIARNEKLVQMNADKEDRHQQDIKDWEERFTNQTLFLRGVQRDLIAANDREKNHIARSAKLALELQFYKEWHCRREDSDDPECCRRREPRQKIPLRYIPFADHCDDCDISDCPARPEKEESPKQ